MQLISKFNRGFRFLFCVIDIYSKYARVFPLKDKKVITISNAFQQILDEYNRKPNKIWVDKGSKFYNRSVKSWLQDDFTEMYSTDNKEKYIAAKRFIRTVEYKIYKYVTSISKTLDIDKLDDIILHIKPSIHITFGIKNDEKELKCNLKLSKYKNIF